MTVIFVNAVTVLRAREVGSVYSSEKTLTWDDPVRIDVPFLVSVQPRGSTEGGTDRPTVVSSWWMCTPPGTDLDLRPEDRVELATGIQLEVVGQPLRWPDPVNQDQVHHVEANLEVVDG